VGFKLGGRGGREGGKGGERGGEGGREARRKGRGRGERGGEGGKKEECRGGEVEGDTTLTCSLFSLSTTPRSVDNFAVTFSPSPQTKEPES
jgi:hypothetical protein